jgi:superfamily II DNA/RNA helicase
MSTTFHALGVSDAVERVLAQRGISEPFPVQEAVLRDALAGRDVVAQAPTGSGKTLGRGGPRRGWRRPWPVRRRS